MTSPERRGYDRALAENEKLRAEVRAVVEEMRDWIISTDPGAVGARIHFDRLGAWADRLDAALRGDE